MYEETGPDGRRMNTVEQIAAEFGVARPTIYRHLGVVVEHFRTAVVRFVLGKRR
ncbi:hypothetical protein [Polymorphospora rubra]|uniref:hypothetical protein n=1 Tax=Polymorphospora rubra TaxID=338584 RepID=UPI0034093EB5